MSAKQAAIDARLTELLPQVTLLQDSYLANYGRYFQGLATHAELPDGETFAPVDVTVRPSDQPHNYADFWRRVHWTEPNEDGEREETHEFPESVLAEVDTLTTRIRFNVSCGVNGHSWALILDYQDDTGHWSRTVNATEVVSDWEIVEPTDDEFSDGLLA
jgi:hypothetical protein